ncbi:putative 4-aminobutyrate aminotransferase, partial [Tetrabaena socialis]
MSAAGSGSAAARAGLGLAAVLRGGTAAAVRQTLDGVYAHTPPGVGKFNVSVQRGRGIGAVSTGHCHPTVVEAVRRQAGRVVHAQQNIFGAHEAMVDLYDRLSVVLPPSLDSYFLANSGAEAVDNAVKMARAATGRQNVIAFEGGFHGRTLGSMALTSSKTIYRQGFGPLMPGVHIAPYPYCLHCKPEVCLSGCEDPGLAGSTAKAQAVAGHSGYPRVEERGRRDIGCCGGPLEKPVGNKAANGARGIKHWATGGLEFAGAELAPKTYGMQGLADIAAELPPGLIADVRGRGLMVGVEFGGGAPSATAATSAAVGAVGPGLAAPPPRFGPARKGVASAITRACAARNMLPTNQPARASRPQAITRACAARDMLLLSAGARESVRFLPPLTVSAAEVDMALGIFREACREVLLR